MTHDKDNDNKYLDIQEKKTMHLDRQKRENKIGILSTKLQETVFVGAVLTRSMIIEWF